jgi:hypothetical protein
MAYAAAIDGGTVPPGAGRPQPESGDRSWMRGGRAPSQAGAGAHPQGDPWGGAGCSWWPTVASRASPPPPGAGRRRQTPSSVNDQSLHENQSGSICTTRWGMADHRRPPLPEGALRGVRPSRVEGGPGHAVRRGARGRPPRDPGGRGLRGPFRSTSPTRRRSASPYASGTNDLRSSQRPAGGAGRAK